MMKIMDRGFGVDNLLESVFLNASGKAVKLSSEIQQDRTAGMTFFWFYCRINLTQEDSYIKQDPL